ncbi:MAG: alpha-N-acetylglucosaminidase [Bacteroidetes bacterium]|nr:alpha-N-acetylglucosaminidase [Bacteroidota bacterium]
MKHLQYFFSTQKRTITFLISVIIANTSFSQLNKQAVQSFLQRIVKEKSTAFVAEYISPQNGKDIFEIESKKGKIILRGCNGVSIASALNYYLKNYCHCLITWNGINMNMPGALPVVKGKIHRNTPYQYRYYLNYCTFNYSMSWWDWDRWQKEIDWMALNGINMPLAVTGEEAVWQRLYKKMGFSDAELDKFFCGPAYFSWFWMGNLDAWGGPLPQHWKDSHEALQKKILEAERSMGMKPVLPAFTGHVPPSFKEKFPSAKVKKTNWGAGFDDVYILDPSDPMFEQIGKAFIEEQTNTYGSDHLYSADTFNENLPPTNDSTYLNDISKKVFESMALADPKAVWVMQGWMFHYQADFWKPTQIQALLNAVPDDHMIMLDLYSESHPVWSRTNAYYGKPWIWNMLHNFGGNISLWGRMNSVAENPSAALHDNTSGKMIGIGLTPEGIEQNPALYHLMLENVWNDKAINVEDWLSSYARQRYGADNSNINEAWKILLKTVYNGGFGEGGPETIIQARPTTNGWADRVRTKLDYNSKDLLPAWDLFVKEIPALQNSDGFQYDLVDLTRQVLANYALTLQQKWALAYLQHDVDSYEKYSDAFLELMDDMDELLASRKDFLLGKWIAEARACGVDEKEKDLYEFNARDIITLWGDKESELHEYSNRQWAGLIKRFYKPRWEQFFIYMKKKMLNGGRMETTDFEKSIKEWEWNWVNSRDTYSSEPTGNSMGIVNRLYKKYTSQIEKE